MGSLTACLKTIGKALSQEDKSLVIARARELRQQGMSPSDAAKKAVRAMLAEQITRIRDAKQAAGKQAPGPQLKAKTPETEAPEATPEVASPAAQKPDLKEQVRAAALRQQAEAGWDPSWPFVPADLVNFDFRKLLREDPAVSAEEKRRIFDAGEKLGVVPLFENAQYAELERRRAERTAERETFKALMSNPEVTGMSVANIKALIYAKTGDTISEPQRDKLARAIHAEAASRAAELAKQKHRDPEVFAAALDQAKQLDNIPADDTAMAGAYTMGWTHALQGRTRSSLAGELINVRLHGFDAAQRWMETDEGAAWYEGRPVNKLENTGVDLRRWYEQLRAQMKAEEGDVQKAWKQIERATARADLFVPLLPEGVTPGYFLYVDQLRKNMRTFKEWLQNNHAYEWTGILAWRGRGEKSDLDYILEGSRYPGVLDTASQQRFQNDEEFRAQWLRDSANEYLRQARDLIATIEGTSSVAEAAAKWSKRFISKDPDAAAGDTGAAKLSEQGTKASNSAIWSEGGLIREFYNLRRNSPFTQHLVKNEATLALPDRATPLTPPKLENVVREGRDLRGGKDVTPQQFKERFGVADVGFGKWVGAKADQDHLNYSHDAFADLAKLLGFDESNIGFGGRLHFTVGALGHGKHAAHFSPNQPSPIGPVQVINVTNTKGDGTVAHEWTHALDHFLGGEWTSKVRPRLVAYLEKGVLTVEGVENAAKKFLTGGWYWQGDKRIPKVDAAILAMNRPRHLYKRTAYASNADALGKPYWGNEKELIARAGESFVYDTLGFRSDYLVNAWVGDGVTTKKSGYRGTPYPSGEERKQFNAIFGALFKAVKWDNGRPTVSRADFEAALPKEITAGEKRRLELADKNAMLEFNARLKQEEADAQMAKDLEAAAAKEAEQRLLDEMAKKAIQDMRQATELDAPQPSETQGQLTDEDLSDLFDQAAAETREEKQEDPTAAEPGDEVVWPTHEQRRERIKAEDWQVIHDHLAAGTPVLLAEEGYGLPTIHTFGRLGQTDMVGFGVFKTVGDGWSANWDGGGAMSSTPNGLSYTTVHMRGDWAGVYDMAAAKSAVGANLAEKSVSSVSSVPPGPSSATLSTEPGEQDIMPEWAGRFMEMHAGSEYRFDGNELVGLFKGKEIGRLPADRARKGDIMSRFPLEKVMLEAVAQDLGLGPLTGEGTADTSVQDKRKRQQQKDDEYTRARREVEESARQALEAGAPETARRLSSMLKDIGHGVGPKAAFEAAENSDRMIQKELEAAENAKSKPEPKGPEAERSAYFAPGNVVRGYAGFDEVLAYRPGEGAGRWSVQVHEVKKIGDEWVRVGKPQDARWHSTVPNRSEIKQGPFAVLDPQPGSSVKYTEPRADGKPFANAPDRGKPASDVPGAKALLAKAAQLGITGADEALTGLAKLFGARPGQLNSFPAGFDEETYRQAKPHFEAALKAAQEAGRTLKEFFKALIELFDEGIKQYAIRFAKDMELTAQLGQKPDASVRLAEWVRTRLNVGHSFDWRTLFAKGDEVFGGTQAEGRYTPKDAYDAMEMGINLHILSKPQLYSPAVSEEDAQRAVASLGKLLTLVPTQSKRTSEQDQMQQFSTVPPLAFVANWVAGVRSTDVMLEPSAGLGGLSVFAKAAGARVVLNELSSRRAALLQQIMSDSQVFQEDGQFLHNILPDEIRPTLVVMNPPFSNSAGGVKSTMVGAQHVEQALSRLEPGGRLVAIVGEGMAMDKPAFRDWWKKISSKYDVRAAVPMDGSGYAKYGTTFDNVILVIDKVAPSGRKPVTTKTQEYTDLVHLLAEVRHGRPEPRVPLQDHSAESDPRGSTRTGVPEGDRPPGQVPSGNGDVAGVGAGQPGRRPGVGGGRQAGAGTGRGQAPGGHAGGDRSGGAAAGQDQDRGGRDDAAVGGRPGASGDATGVTVQAAQAKSAELTDSVFEGYQPQRLQVPGSHPHPGPLVQSAAMASVVPPAPTYTPNLPAETIQKGLLSIAQIEAVVYAGQAHQQLLDTKVDDLAAKNFKLVPGVPYRRGFFIGDGTGVGKGREISGILLDNIRQGRTKHVWVSEKQGLLNDAARDFAGVQDGATEVGVLKSGQIFNLSAKTRPGTWDVTADDGVLYTTYATLRSAQKYGNFDPGDEVETTDGRTGVLTSINVKSSTVNVRFPGEKKVVKLPFDEVASIDNDSTWRETVGKKPPAGWKPRTRIDQIVEWLGPQFDGVIAFDEAHNAGNAVVMKGERGDSKPSAMALAVVELQKRLPNARVVYVSATGATEVSNLSFATRLGLWGPGTPFPDVKTFIAKMEAGGLATMELVARDLKQLGAYMARSLSYDGVMYSRVEHELTEIDHDIYNRLCDAWQVVLNNIEEALVVSGVVSDSGKVKNSKAKSAAMSAFWGAQQRFFNQVITSLQMPTVIDAVERDMADGHAVVLQLVNTNEAQQERAMGKRKAEEGEDADLEDLDLTPRDALLEMVRKSFPVTQYTEEIDENGKPQTVVLLDSHGKPVENKEAVAMRDKLLEDLAQIRVPDGPLERLINHFGPSAVAEITGRKQRVVAGRWNTTHRGEGESKAFTEKRTPSSVTADASAFMDDQKRILVFSDAGGTGFSFQSDLRKRNQRQRQHYLIQPGWRANKAVQGLGRTHRTNQANTPHYKLVSTTIPAHKRFLSSIARRLDQLGALTKGQRDTSSGGLFSEKDNLESKYAERAVRALMFDAHADRVPGLVFNDLLSQLGLKKLVNPEGKIVEDEIPGVRQFLNRLLSLNIETQHIVFDAFITRMEDLVEIAAERGELDTGMQTIKALEARISHEEVAHVDERTGAETSYVQLELTHPTRIYPFPGDASTGAKFDWVLNAKSGRVWGKQVAGTVTNKDNKVLTRYRMLGTGGMAFRTEDDFKDPAAWKSIGKDEARTVWAKETSAKPPTYTDKAHMLVGALLPIWDRIATDSTMQVARVQTNDGRRLLGRRIHESEIDLIRRRLSLAAPENKLPAAEIMARILQGEDAELGNGWVLERVRVSGELRIEISSMGRNISTALHNELTGIGVIEERINWNARYFVPVGKPDVLAALIKNRPVVGLRKPNAEDQGQLKQVKGPPGAGVALPELDKMLAAASKDWGADAPRAAAVATVAELPDDIRAALSSMGAMATTRGMMMPDGRVFLVADRLGSMDEAQSVLFHEVYGHYGLRAFLGDDYEAQMTLLRAANPKLAAEANTWYANFARGQIAARMQAGATRSDAEKTVRLLAVEEALADRAGDAPPPSGWKSVMAKLQAALRRLGMDRVADFLERLTEAETHALLMGARRAVSRQGGPVHALAELPAGLRRAASSPAWYSALLREVGKAPMGKATAQAWTQYLDALAKKGAVKSDEIQWSGVTDWLGLQQGPVTRGALAEYLAGNGVQVEETVLGSDITEHMLPAGWTVEREGQGDDAGYIVVDESGELQGEGRTAQEAMRDAADPDLVADIGSVDGMAKYGQHTLPGGTNYREVLLRLPSRIHEITDSEIEHWYRKAYGASITEDAGPDWRDRRDEFINDMARPDREDRAGRDYFSRHWDQSNVLAHIRLNDRADASGARVLFVEEIQSDWGQEGKSKGFAIAGSPEAGTKTIYRVVGRNEQQYIALDTQEQAQSFIDSYNERTRSFLRIEPMEVSKSPPRPGVPKAPFVTHTDKWVALALKRIVKMAVDEGYDKVAFVNGEQSADRYDLSKQVDEILFWGPEVKGDFEAGTGEVGISIYAKGGQAVKEQEIVSHAELENLVGKELAERIVRGDAPQAKGQPTGVRRLSGLDLKVGGEGMRAFYDTIVPSVLKDVLRKVGGGKLETVEVGGGKIPAQAVSWGDSYERAKNPERFKTEMLRQPGFSITPAMREAAGDGLPLFKQRRARADLAWSERGQNTEGPEFYGNGIGLISIQQLSDDDFAPNAMPLGHGFRVQPGHTVHKFLIVDSAGSVLGQADLEVDRGGNVEAIHDIAVDSKGAGTGRQVVEAILASAPGPVRLIDIVPGAERFWDRMGAGYKDVYGDATTDWKSLQAADARALAQGWTRTGQGVEADTGAGGQAAPAAPLLSQRSPALESALRKAGIRGPRTLREKIRAYYGRAVESVRSSDFWKEAGAEVRQGALDQFYGIKRATTREAGNLPVEQDPYVTARLANGGTSSVMRALLLHGQARWNESGQHLEKIPGTRGLLDILAPLGNDLNDWFGWMVGNRAARMMREGRENNLTADEIKALQDLATPDREDAFKRAAVEFASFKRSVLDVAQAAGLINPESRRVWDHADYIPFYREIDQKALFSPTGKKGLSGQSSGIRTLKGGESALNDPMENVLMNFSRLIDASLKNNAIDKTVEALEEAESDVISKVGYDVRPAMVLRKEIVAELSRMGTPDTIIASLPEEVFDGIAKMWAIQAPTDPDVVRVMRGGKPKFYRVNDRQLLKALTSFVPFDFPGLAMMRGAKRLLTAVVTTTPEFAAANWIRDSLAAQAIAKTGFNPVESIKGMARSYKEEGGFEAMLFAGASFQSGYVNAADPEATAIHVRRALRKRGMNAAAVDSFMGSVVDFTATGWEKWRQVGEAIENANREAVYEATRKRGGSVAEAAFESKDLMDFSLRGSWAAYQVAADVLPFFNARVQGLYRLGRSDPKRLMMTGAVMVAATAILALLNTGEDWYERLADWDKDTYWHAKVGGHHFRIPKPFELGVLFGTLPERIARGFMGYDPAKKTISRIFANVRDQLAFNPIPQGVRPAVEIWANKDLFRDRPIEGMADESKRPHARYDARTSDTMRVLANVAPGGSDWMNLSPKKLEHLVYGYFGAVGMYALSVSDAAVRAAEGKPARPAMRVDDLPVVRRFYQVDPARATVFESDIYEMRQEIEKIVAEINALSKSRDKAEQAKAIQLMKDERVKLRARGIVVPTARSLTSLSQQISAVYADPQLTPDQKRAKIDLLQEKKNALAQRMAKRPEVRAAY